MAKSLGRLVDMINKENILGQTHEGISMQQSQLMEADVNNPKISRRQSSSMAATQKSSQLQSQIALAKAGRDTTATSSRNPLLP